jgi:hypothetical protein
MTAKNKGATTNPSVSSVPSVVSFFEFGPRRFTTEDTEITESEQVNRLPLGWSEACRSRREAMGDDE